MADENLESVFQDAEDLLHDIAGLMHGAN